MPTSGSRFYGTATCIRKKRGFGSRRRAKNNSSFAVSPNSPFSGCSQPRRSWERTQRPCPKRGAYGIKSGPIVAIAFLPEPDGLEKDFRTRSRLPSRSPKVWADAYLLAFASVAGLKLVTFDRGLKSGGAEVLLL